MTESAGVSKKRFENWMKGNLLETLKYLGLNKNMISYDFIMFQLFQP